MKLVKFPGPQACKTKYVQNNVVNEPRLTIFCHSHAQRTSSQRNSRKSLSHRNN